jgi:uncharacterized membrane protein
MFTPSRLVGLQLLSVAIAVVTAAAPHRINEFVVRLISIIVIVVGFLWGRIACDDSFVSHTSLFFCSSSISLCSCVLRITLSTDIIFNTSCCKNGKILEGHTRPEDYSSPLPHEYIAEEDLRKYY